MAFHGLYYKNATATEDERIYDITSTFKSGALGGYLYKRKTGEDWALSKTDAWKKDELSTAINIDDTVDFYNFVRWSEEEIERIRKVPNLTPEPGNVKSLPWMNGGIALLFVAGAVWFY